MKNDGGPAFPYSALVPDHRTGTVTPTMFDDSNGMSLRDYFASKAQLHDIKFASPDAAAEFAGMPKPTDVDSLVKVAMAAVAKACYIYADAMLAERVK